MREVKLVSEEYPDIEAIRTRTSNGFASITLKVGDKHISFSSENDNDAYEQQALEVAKVLQDVAYNSCRLPKIED